MFKMHFKSSFLLIVFALSLSSCKSKNIETSSEVSAQNKLPAFSWDKMPLYMHVRKSTAFTNKEIKYLAKLPIQNRKKESKKKTSLNLRNKV